MLASSLFSYSLILSRSLRLGKGFFVRKPFAQAERPTIGLGTTYQACGDLKYNRLFKPYKSPHHSQAERPTMGLGTTYQACGSSQ